MVDTCTNTTVTGIWKLGDAWRDLREDIALAGKPVVAVTTALSIRIIDLEHGFHQRVPTSDNAPYIAGDGFEIELTEIRVANPCGLVLAGSTEDSTSSSMPLILLCAIDDTSDKGLLAVAHAAAAAMGAKTARRRAPGRGLRRPSLRGDAPLIVSVWRLWPVRLTGP